MKRISYWAKSHVLTSRILIVLFWITLNIIGVFVGKLINQLSITIPTLTYNICICLLLILWIGYPQKTDKATYYRYGFYFHKKLFDFLLALLTFILIVYTGNHWKNLFVNTQKATASTTVNLPKDSSLSKNYLLKNFIYTIKSQDVSKMSNSYKKALIKKQIKAVKQTKDLTKTQKTLLIILSVFIALFLLFGVAVLACNLSCSGMEGLAFLVGFGGTTLIILLLSLVLKRINRKLNTKKTIIIAK